MKIVLNNDGEFKFVNELIEKLENNNFLANLVINKYQTKMRHIVKVTYGERFLGLSNGGDTVPYLCVMMNYISDLLPMRKDNNQLFKDNIFLIKKTSKDFEMAYRRWYHDN